jgi:hypothetical protein
LREAKDLMHAPSLSYLKEVEAKAKENQNKTGKTSSIPAEFVEADYNKDGNHFSSGNYKNH